MGPRAGLLFTDTCRYINLKHNMPPVPPGIVQQHYDYEPQRTYVTFPLANTLYVDPLAGPVQNPRL